MAATDPIKFAVNIEPSYIFAVYTQTVSRSPTIRAAAARRDWQFSQADEAVASERTLHDPGIILHLSASLLSECLLLEGSTEITIMLRRE